MDIYLAGTPIEKLFDEVSCGDVGIEGVKVSVPSDRYDSLLGRIGSMDIFDEGGTRRLHYFLASRCDREFLSRFIARFPSFISGLRVYSYLNAVSDVDVIVRLHELGLLPETKRAAVAVAIRELAVEIPDSGFLTKGIRDVLKPDEFKQIMEDVQTKLLPKLGHKISNRRWNWENDEDPEQYFSSFVDTMQDYRKEFAKHPEAISKIDSALTEIEKVVDELRSEQPQEPDSDDYRGGSSSGMGDDSRSVFDDVDQ